MLTQIRFRIPKEIIANMGHDETERFAFVASAWIAIKIHRHAPMTTATSHEMIPFGMLLPMPLEKVWGDEYILFYEKDS